MGLFHVDGSSTTDFGLRRSSASRPKKLIDELLQFLQRRLSNDFEEQRAAASRQLLGGDDIGDRNAGLQTFLPKSLTRIAQAESTCVQSPREQDGPRPS